MGSVYLYPITMQLFVACAYVFVLGAEEGVFSLSSGLVHDRD